MSEAKLAENPEADLDIHKPLERVNYEAGMLLGLEATRAEQNYHRQRVNRLQYWFQGAGTLLGLVVKQVSSVTAEEGTNQSVRLVVSPGVALDGLGRELLCYEPYCVNLRDWLDAQQNSNESFLHTALNNTQTAIQLFVTIRYQASSSGLQPVMTRKVNAGIDPVQPSRAKDAHLLEIIPGVPPSAPEAFYRAGLKLKSVDSENPESVLTETENNYLLALDEKHQLLKKLQTQLLYGLNSDVAALELHGSYEELARVLLATIEIPIRTDKLPQISPIIHPNVIRINNLVRPFITTPDQLSWLSQQEIAS